MSQEYRNPVLPDGAARQRAEGGVPTLFEHESGERLCKCLNYYVLSKWESVVTPRRLFLKFKLQTF